MFYGCFIYIEKQRGLQSISQSNIRLNVKATHDLPFLDHDCSIVPIRIPPEEAQTGEALTKAEGD